MRLPRMLIRKRYPLLAKIALLTVLGTQAEATLLEIDLLVSGDGLITQDTSTGLDWLDLTATQGISIAEISADAGGWLSAGFTWATIDQIATLATNAGVANFAEDADIFTSSNGPGVALLHSLLGTTADGLARGFAHPPYFIVEFALSLPPDPHQGSASAFYSAYHTPVIGGLTIPDPLAGHFLVRPVPEPGTLLLVGLGIGVLGTACRRREAKASGAA